MNEGRRQKAEVSSAKAFCLLPSPFCPEGVFAGGAGAGVLLKSTVGASVLPGAAWKYFRGFAPVTFAVIICGNCRM
jgi:hypothetical protein